MGDTSGGELDNTEKSLPAQMRENLERIHGAARR